MNEQECTPLQRKHPDWNIRPFGDQGCYIATRLGCPFLTDEELVAGLYMTLVEDTLEDLGEALAIQVEIEDSL
ncbi:hypothetical protein [Actinocorallia populi]|uniref:hypothetical protein n=1 Tax=Actinocorallia populi TaxID=2079200 RepID=UPI000D0928EA|nr:hypothetical protein [Actinocorallia populi]